MEKTSKRSKIKIISYISALIAVLTVWGCVQTVKCSKQERQITVAQQRAVTSLAAYLDTLENDLRKMQYVGTQTMASGLSISLCKATSGAKNCLAQLSAGSAETGAVNKFLSQSADYIQSITKKLSIGEKLTNKDYSQISKLYGYAKMLSEEIGYMEQVMLSGNITFDDVSSTLSSLSDKGDLSISYSDTVSKAEEAFSDYPTLIYDGPFSDNMLNKESEMLKSEKEISADEAKTKASECTGIKKENLIRMEDENGTIPAYVFYNEDTTAAITKQGGYLLYMLSDTFALEEKIKPEKAIEAGVSFLNKMGFASLKSSYYSVNDGICTINFAHTQDDAVCYPDLIKISVALDTGKVISADLSGYLMNHKKRELPSDVISEAEASAAVSTMLVPQKSQKAFIPLDDGNEVFAYEIFCKDKNGNDVLVYINAKTGNEADIKLLLYTDGGILTR